MKLTVLGSSSAGNCYLLRSETGQTLAIEAGVRLAEVKRAMGYRLGCLVGCIVSHEHGDHAKYVRDIMGTFTPCYMSQGTRHALGLSKAFYAKGLLPMQSAVVGEFQVLPFPVQHDAKEPFGWLIKHPECGTVLFATDTYYLKYRFDGIANWLIECNYSEDILDANVKAGLIDPMRRDRTLKSHMSYGQCLNTLRANDLSKTNNIVLIHLSNDNSDEQQFVNGLREATGKNVVAARKGMVMDFNKTPY